jgi:RHS repeat-associated protein
MFLEIRMLNKLILALGFVGFGAHMAPAAAQTGTQAQIQWCYGPTCYNSQGEAEAAMKAEINPLDPKGRHLLVPVDPGSNNAVSAWPNVTIHYAVKDQTSTFIQKWYFANPSVFTNCTGGGNLNSPYGCSSLAELRSKIVTFYEGSACNVDWQGTEVPTPVLSDVIGYGTDPRNVYVKVSQSPPNVTKLEYTTPKGNPCVGDLHSGPYEFSTEEHRLCPPYYVGKFGRTLPMPPGRWPFLCRNGEVGSIYSKVVQINTCESNTDQPCSPSTGQKTRNETDFSFDGFEFTRHYHSMVQLGSKAGLGRNWTHNYDSHLLSANPQNAPAAGGPLSMFIVDERGELEQYSFVSTDVYRSSNRDGKVLRKRSSPDMWELQLDSSRVNFYEPVTGRLVKMTFRGQPDRDIALIHDHYGRLRTVTNAKGRSITFRYEGWDPEAPMSPENWNLSKVILPDSSIYQYTVDATGNLTAVTYPSSGIRTFSYTKPGLPGHLTAIGDENGTNYAQFDYDSYGRVTSSTLKTGDGSSPDASWVTLVYNVGNTTTVTKSTGEVITYTFGTDPFQKLLAVTGDAGTLADKTYRSDGRLDNRVDKKGVRTWFDYDATHETVRIEAQGDDSQPANPYSNERKTETSWDSALDVALEQSVYRCAAPDATAQPCNTASSARWELESLNRYAYNARGQVTAQCGVVPGNATTMAYACGSSANAPSGVRQSTTTYCEAGDVTAGTCPLLGLVKSTDGARTDVADGVFHSYYAADEQVAGGDEGDPNALAYRKGDLWKVTNALGQITEYVSYDGAGRVKRIKDANGVITDMTYHARGWLQTRTVRANANGTPNASLDATTTLTYDNVGQVTRVAQPDGAFIDYTYDDAHRLTDINDNLGNKIAYTLDAAGNRIAENTRDPSNTLTRTLGRVYNSLGRLHKLLNAQSAETVFTYDANGNQDTVTDALTRVTDSDVDPLNRLIQSTDALMGNTKYRYDARDNLVEVTDAKNLSTGYTYDGLNNLIQLTSPDTGETSYTYDAAGNRATQTDARGTVSTYSYDVLNRLTEIAYPNDPGVAFTYDETHSECEAGETFGIGRLTGFTDPTGRTLLCYDLRGNVRRKIAMVNGVDRVTAWTYTVADRLSELTYPSGMHVYYGRDSIGRINSVSLLPAAEAGMPPGTIWPSDPVKYLITNVSYYPFGPVKQITWAGGATTNRSYDQNYWIDSINSSQVDGLDLDFTLDAVGNITGISDVLGGTPPNNSYAYDALYRLIDVDVPGSNVETYTYDAIGNRLSKLVGAASAAMPYVYPSNSHRLNSVGGVSRAYDDNGNTVSLDTAGDINLFYDERNRLTQKLDAGSNVLTMYSYNARGERVVKYDAGDKPNRRVFDYDESGRLLTDERMDGDGVQELIWLDDLPVGLFTGGVLHQIHPDHLGSPRKVMDVTAGTAIWDWPILNNPFGEAAPNQDPDGDSTDFVMNLRFPGQYFDVETGLHYNYFRDYEPGTGRYVESDPIGLAAAFATYAYVSSEPIGRYDPFGEAEHTKNRSPSNLAKHEKGKARAKMDRGGEKGDASRRPPNKRPPNWKKPWPPKPTSGGRGFMAGDLITMCGRVFVVATLALTSGNAFADCPNAEGCGCGTPCQSDYDLLEQQHEQEADE